MAPTPSMTPPTKGGTGGFVIAAIIMLFLMGGLIYWKMSGTEAEPVAAAPPPPPPPAAPVLEEPPPPPPPIEPDAAAEETKKVVHSGGRRKAGPGPCGGKCTGRETPALVRALGGRAGQARGCYNRALRLNPTLKGRITVNVRVGPGGRVCSASVGSNTLGDASVASCVVQMFRSATLPSPQGGCVDTAVPINFVPKS